MPGAVRPFAFEGLPNLPRVAVARSRAVARGLSALSPLRMVNARGLGRVALSVERIETSPWSAEGTTLPESAFSLVRDDGSWACLVVERFFALSLVRAALGAPAPPVVRPLSPAERGVLGAMVAAMLASLGAARVRLSLEPARALEAAPPGRSSAEYVVVQLSVRAASAAGGASLEVPVSWLPSVAPRLPPEAGLLLETVLGVELGRTSLPGAAWLAAELGDAVVFEGVSAPRDDAPWSCEVSIGAQRGQAELSPRGQLRLAAPFALVPTSVPGRPRVSRPRQGGPEDGSTDRSAGSASGDLRAGDFRTGEVGRAAEDQGGPRGESAFGDGGALLASAPVEVVAELGRVTLRGDEVMGLANGAVIALGERRRDLVTLRVGGRTWARGELVNVDDQLGVRITELFRPR